MEEKDIIEVKDEAEEEAYDEDEDLFIKQQIEKMQRRRQEVMAIVEEVKAKHRDKKLYFVDVPYIGLYIFTRQTHGDVQKVNEAVSKLTEEFIEKHGGQEAWRNMSEKERTKLTRELDEKIADLSNFMTLKRCVVYPENFAADVDNGNVPSGVASLLLEKILEVSGWVEVVVEEA